MIGELDRREFMKGVILQTSALAALGLRGEAHDKPGSIPLVAFRIGTTQWMTEERFRGMLDFFAHHPGTVDELAFFTSATHPPLPLDEIERRAAKLQTLLPRVREHGMRAGINVLATMGHHEENLDHSLKTSWQHVMDPSGNISLGSYCPSHPELIDYARKVYASLAAADPDFIWIDDDMRLGGHMPVNYICFCDLCMRQFSEQVGRQFTRETLVAAFDAGSLEERLRLRRAWLEHNRGVIDNLLKNIEEAAHKVKPGLSLGLMTGDRFYEGYGFERWAKTLAGPRQAPVRWRPGGGFYSDESPLGLVQKAHELGRQASALPSWVETIQSEVENFPYQMLRKSKHTTVVEAAAEMAAGSTGTAFNVLSMYAEPLDEYIPLFDQIANSRPFYEVLQTALGRSMATGIWPAWNHDVFSAANPDGKWLSNPKLPFMKAFVLGEIGIPLCYDSRGSTATALAGSTVFAFQPEQLREMFSGGVLMDAEAWSALKRLGLEKWTGVSGLGDVDHDATEVFAKHPLNGKFAGWSRDCRQSFWHERAYSLEFQDGRVETLARMVDYAGQDLGPCMTAYTNELGGRVVMLGYFPWSQIHGLAKSSQMKAVCAWLSGGRLPAFAESFEKVALWCREGVRGKKAIIVVNTSLDPVRNLALQVLTKEPHFAWTGLKEGRREITAEQLAASPGHVRVTIERLEPWSIHVLVNGAA